MDLVRRFVLIALSPEFRNILPCNQLFCLVVQLHLQCNCRNVNCPSSPSATELNLSPSFPEPIPLGTRVPHWAYIDSTIVRFSHYLFFLLDLFSFFLQSGSWNATTAQLAGGTYFCQRPLPLCILGSVTDSPEVTGSASVIPSSTSSSQSAQSTITSNTSSPLPSKGSSNAGAIAGGVVGGIIGVALIAGLVAWFTIRRSRSRSVRPLEHSGDQGSDMAVVPYPSDIGALKLYVSLVFPHPATVRAYKSVTDLLIALSRTLPTRAHTQRMRLPQRSSPRTQADGVSALRPICKLTKRHTAASRKSDRLRVRFSPPSSFPSSCLLKAEKTPSMSP